MIFQTVFRFLTTLFVFVGIIAARAIVPDSSEIRISFVGDLMCHTPQLKAAENPDGTYNFDPVFKYVKPYLLESDFVVGNLETVTGGPGRRYSGYPLFNTPDSYLDALKSSGFDLLVTANNHALDQGVKGLKRTIEKIKERGLQYSGTFRDLHDRDSVRIFEIKGKKFSILSYTYGINGNYLPESESYVINQIDTLLIKKDIESAKMRGSEFVIVFVHWGIEYQRYADKFQKNMGERIVSYGADLIIGSHPHVLQPFSFIRKNKNKDSVFVAWSLGNFVSNQQWRYSDAGCILNLSLSPGKKEVIILEEAEVVPTWVFKGNVESSFEYIIFPSVIASQNFFPDYFTASQRERLRESYFDFLELNKSNNFVKIIETTIQPIPFLYVF